MRLRNAMVTVGLGLALALTIGACGDDDDDSCGYGFTDVPDQATCDQLADEFDCLTDTFDPDDNTCTIGNCGLCSDIDTDFDGDFDFDGDIDDDD